MQLEILTGQRFGRLVVGERAPNVGRNTMWHCSCDCGKTTIVAARHLKSGRIISCRCYQVEFATEFFTKHGDAPSGTQSDEYRIWRHIKSRCLNPNETGYAYYGGRGITICDAWKDNYAQFLADMGRRPSDRHSIGRIDNGKGYEPGNCRWETPVQQGRNRRSVTMTLEIAEQIRSVRAKGVSLRAICEQFGASMSTVSHIVTDRIWRPDHV